VTGTVERAIREYQAENHIAARKLAQAVVAEDPANAFALNLLALTCLGSPNEAISLFRRAAALDPTNFVYLVNLSAARLSAGNVTDASRGFERSAILSPDSPIVHGGRAESSRLAGDLLGAWRSRRREVLLSPSATPTRRHLGADAVEAGRIEDALATFRELTTLVPGDGDAWYRIGAVLLTLGEVERAETALTRALIVAPGHVEAERGRLRSRRALFARGQTHKAECREGLFIRGPMNGVSGYSHMTNRFIRSLFTRNIPMNIAGIYGDENWASRLDVSMRSKISLSFLTPPVVEILPGLRNGLFSMFEGTIIPPEWKAPSDLVDLVVVPSRSSKEAWMARGHPEDRVRVCPLGVEEEQPGTPPFTLRDAAGRPFQERARRVLNVSDLIPRKNVDGLLRVWLRATSNRDDAVLVLKLGKGRPGARREIQRLIEITERVVGKKMSEAAPVVFLDKTITETQMSGLFWMSTHYLSMSHGEGWDLPMSRAGALGLRLIAPAHSAYLDYLDDTVAHMIPSVVRPAHATYSREPWPPFHGIDWWEPDEDAAAEILTRVVNGRDHVALDAGSRLLSRFTWNQATDRLLSVLGELAV